MSEPNTTERMTEFIGVPVTPTMFRQVSEAAELDDRNLAQFVRHCISVHLQPVQLVDTRTVYQADEV